MATIPISIAAKVAEYPVLPILRQFDYLFDFNGNLNNLTEQAEKLKIVHHQVNQQVQRAKIRGDLIEPEVQKWLASVDEVIDEVGKIEEQSKTRRSCFGGFCPNCIYRYRVSRKSTKKAVSIAPLPGIEYYSSSKNFIAFDSRKEATDQIMEALGDDDSIGIPISEDHNKGCKILMTTENEKMWRVMGDGVVKKVEIQALSDEDSWRLFRSVTGEIVETPGFKVVADEIVGKCKGLPLMIVTIGKKLKNKGIEEWKDLNRIIGANSANLDEILD
ncbi:disease resistance protein [Senna tora]|uniref:Disease resistance protein n=1 Tax=Senna tora TaxID=362788 RepID=A0A834WAU4_9FABA|nr:disease resistance protein [Senna tora]